MLTTSCNKIAFCNGLLIAHSRFRQEVTAALIWHRTAVSKSYLISKSNPSLAVTIRSFAASQLYIRYD